MAQQPTVAREQLALCWAVLALCLAATAAAQRCARVPEVSGVDQSPTAPWNYGKCTKTLEGIAGSSHWCKFNRLGVWPAPPPSRAQQCLKFGRATIYRGPIYGSSAQHYAACNKILRGSDTAAMVALSTKYLKTYQGGWTSDKGACDKCMCVRLHGADTAYNPGFQDWNARKHMGLTFLARVGDRCAECPDDSVDILMDRPFSYAPFDPKRSHDNTYAPYVNGKEGLRGFTDPDTIRGSGSSPENVGTWTADWQFVPCSYTHDKCGALMKEMGYDNVFTPKMTSGVDSYSLRELAMLRPQNASYLTDEPYANEPGRKGHA